MLTSADILFTDNNLLIVNKQPDLTVIPGRGNASGISLREIMENKIGGKLFVVHRIDRGTSGIVIFALNPDAHRNLCRQFEIRKVKKEYLVVVYGKMQGSGVIEKPIKQFGSGRMGICDEGKPSVTRYEVIERFNNTSLLKVFPLTGRRHQIRVHLCDAGFPVLGDTLYGTDRPVGGAKRLMLHANSVSFEYPEEKEFSISAPVELLWSEIIGNLRLEPFVET